MVSSLFTQLPTIPFHMDDHFHLFSIFASVYIRFFFLLIKMVAYSIPSLLFLALAQTVKRLHALQETWVQSLGWEDPLDKGMQPTPVFLPGESHGQRNLVGYSPWGHKESGTTHRLTLSLHCTFLRICLNLSSYNFSTFCFLFKNPLSSHENVLLCHPLNF